MIVSLVMAAARLAAVLAPLERDQARDAARRELQREVYHRDDPSPLTRLLQTAGRVIGRIVDRAGQLAPGGTVGLLLLLALALALLAAIRLTAGPLARSPGRLDGGFRTGARTAEDHRQEADRLAAQGAWADAVRERLRAVVAELEQRGVLERRPGRTAGEVAAEAGALVPAIAGDLRSAAHTFDHIWYAGRPADPEADALLRGVDDRVRRTRLSVEPDGVPASAGRPAP